MSIEDRVAAMRPEERLARLRELNERARTMLEQHDGNGIVEIEIGEAHGPDRS
jgi:hypothetical protein